MNSHHHDDLAMMLRRCASALQAAGRADIAAAAMGLLERLGLGASPLRDVADAPAPAQQAEAPNGLPPLPAIDDYLPTDGPRWTTANFIACAQRYATDYARAALAATPAPADLLPSAEHIKELAQEAFDQVMEQAQVFASAWSLVGGRFDTGNAMDDAEDAKAELRTMARSLADLAAQTVRPVAATPAPAPLTNAQFERLYNNLPPSIQQDARSRLAFIRIGRAVEAAHGIKEQP